MIRLIAMRELRSLLAMPSTWFVLAVLQLILAWFFLARLEAFLEIQPQLAQLANPPGVTLTVAAPLFYTAALLLMMLVPMFTMRLIAEERRNQTLTLLLAAPLSGRHIVLGKFTGLLLFLLTIISSLPLMIYTLALGTQLDGGLLFANCIGLLLLTASFVALGLYISSLTAQPIIAAIGAMENRFAAPDPTLGYMKTTDLPWTLPDSAGMKTDGCAFASELLNFADSLGGVISSAKGALKESFSSMSAVQQLLYQTCEAGCSVPNPAGPCNLGCTACPTALRDRSKCAGTLTDEASCSAAALVNSINASWEPIVP